jgi:hypothetical protein
MYILGLAILFRDFHGHISNHTAFYQYTGPNPNAVQYSTTWGFLIFIFDASNYLSLSENAS